MELTFLDWIVFILVLAISFASAWFYAGIKRKNDPKYAYFPWAVLIKLVGGALFTATFFYLYKVGDTFLYFGGSETLSRYFWENPQLYFEALFSGSEETLKLIPGIVYEIPYARTEEEWFMVRILSVFQIISFNNYLLMIFWTSLFSFIGSWKIFEVFNSWFNNVTKTAFIASFLIPTVIFWSSGIIKDSLVFGMIGLAFHSFYKLFIQPDRKYVLHSFLLLFSLWITFNLKSYIVISLVPPLFFALYLQMKNQLTNPFMKRLAGPAMLVVFGVFLSLLVNVLIESSKKYQLDNLEKQARGFHTWHVTTGGSAYTLGEIEYSATGVLSKVPAALNVTFFRPYPWEIRNATMALAAVESIILLILFLYFLFYRGIKSIRFALNDPLFGFTIMFCFILGFRCRIYILQFWSTSSL
ncbi:MAG: hypothetical protein KDC84_09335 [Crocinitomicaceae bacterium]|nr:hypothetical protein [Crocinitomicaceae bacterium]